MGNKFNNVRVFGQKCLARTGESACLLPSVLLLFLVEFTEGKKHTSGFSLDFSMALLVFQYL